VDHEQAGVAGTQKWPTFAALISQFLLLTTARAPPSDRALAHFFSYVFWEPVPLDH